MHWRQRFNNKVQQGDGCWEWLGGLTSSGYGKFWLDGGTVLAHRVAYELWVGPIPEDLHLDHLCRRRSCVNPTHLEPVTVRENLLRSPLTLAGQNAIKTHCRNGHEFNDANTLVLSTTGERMCRPCMRARDRARYWAKRQSG